MSLQIPQSVLQVGDGLSEGQSQVSHAGLRTDRPLSFESPLSQHLIQREVSLAWFQISCARHQWETGCLHG